MASQNDMPERIINVLRESGNTPMKALDIANKLASNSKGISLLKKGINRVIFHMNEVERVDANEKPPRWQLKPEYYAPSMPTQAMTPNISSHTPTVHATKQTDKYIQAGLPTLDPAPLLITPVCLPIYNSQTANQSAAIPGEESSEQQVIRVLQSSSCPLSALAIAQEIGLTSRSDVNPILYDLEKKGIVKRHTSPSDKKPLWTIVGSNQTQLAIHTQSMPNMSEQPRQESNVTLQSSSTGTLPTAGPRQESNVTLQSGSTGTLPTAGPRQESNVTLQSSSTGTLPTAGPRPGNEAEAGVGELLYRRTNLDHAVLFTEVTALIDHPASNSTLETQTVLNEPIQAPVAESTPQIPHVQAFSSQVNTSLQVSRPIQVTADDRNLQPSESDEPVVPLDPINFAGERRELGAAEKRSAAKDTESKNMQSFINDLNNTDIVITNDGSFDDPSSSTLSSSQQASSQDDTTSSLSSLSLSREEDSPIPISHTAVGTSTPRQTGANGASKTGQTSSESSRASPTKKKKKSKRKIAAVFPDQPKSYDKDKE